MFVLLVCLSYVSTFFKEQLPIHANAFMCQGVSLSIHRVDFYHPVSNRLVMNRDMIDTSSSDDIKISEAEGNDSFFHYKYKYVDPSISEVLNKSPEEYHYINYISSFVSTEKGYILWDILDQFIHKVNGIEACGGKNVIKLDILIVIASHCEEVIFSPSFNVESLCAPLKGLISMSKWNSTTTRNDFNENHNDIFIATLISLNMLESSIRDLVGKEHGRAPLLKDMIEIISDMNEAKMNSEKSLLLSSLLRSLLLPNIGINLRNLLWHGFVSCIHRRWFALSLVLILTMDELSGVTRDDEAMEDDILLNFKRMRNYDEKLVQFLEYGKTIAGSQSDIEILIYELINSEFIPKTHDHLLTVLNRPLFLQKYPVISASLMGILSEHGLRLWWCDVNDEIDQKVAKPGAYYVTLDGNSQRDKHDLVLLPYLSSGSRNQLVHELGGPTIAILADLFASHEGPNIRASIAHGLCNKYLYKELQSICMDIEGVCPDSMIPDEINDLVYANLFLMKIMATKEKKINKTLPNCSSENLIFYRPVFSYSAVMARGINAAIDANKALQIIITSEEQVKDAMTLSGLSSLTTILSPGNNNRKAMNNDLQQQIFDILSLHSTEIWSCEDTFRERESNKIASNCGASILLLNEVAAGIQSYLQDLERSMSESREGSPTSRRRKQIVRIFSMADMTQSFYNVCILCALLHIRSKLPQSYKMSLSVSQELPDETLLHAVKRSRMVTSTFTTATNVDRAIKSMSDFLQGKSIKMILQIQEL